LLEYAIPKIQSKTQNKFLFNMSQAMPQGKAPVGFLVIFVDF